MTMQLQSGYAFLEKLSYTGNGQLYRAERFTDRHKVIVRVVECGKKTMDEAAHIVREYETLRHSSCQGIARVLELKTYPTQYVSILEDVAGITLEQFLHERKTGVASSLKIAIALTEILESFHQLDLVHHDFCPAHVLINPATLEVTLLDFSLASRLSVSFRNNAEPGIPKRLLPYISPEQTGRIKGEIDIRSSLYTLGIVLYELLTGQVPFHAEEALTLIHFHIAKSPVPPHLLHPHIPVVISGIILKLLSKNPGDRYQSPFGLKKDLQKCLTGLNSDGSMDFFELSQYDFSGRLQTPKHFFGRKEEKKILLQALKRVNAGAVETLLIEGYSGIGKSALAHQLKNAVRMDGRIFIEGKFNQYQGNTPYITFIQAFKDFTDYILMQSQDEILVWRERILQGVGVNGRVLTDVIPHLELLIGPQPAVPDLEPKETQNRFHYIFLNFISSISKPDLPLIVFFDDLQWADVASMNLLKIILTNKDLQAFFFIGAYRNNEIQADSILTVTLADLQKKGFVVENIHLQPLPYQYAEELIRETLVYEAQYNPALVDLIYNKSKGNPFFINAFLKCLHSENILGFDYRTFTWAWDVTKVNQLRFSGDIVELMAGRLRNLPAATQSQLQIAACLGYDFDIQLLIAVLQTPRPGIDEVLQPALEENLIMPSGDNYCFTHDRIQQAAYSLIPDAEKKREHLKIGQALLKHLNKNNHQTYIFEIVNQLNAGRELLASQEEKDELATLNLAAGLKAKSSAAYKTSFEYLLTGISLLAGTAWSQNYQLTLHLYSEGAESAFLSGSNQLMEEWVHIILHNTSNALDKVKAYEIKIKSYTAQDKLLDAVQTSFLVLELLGIRFPKNPTKLHVVIDLLQIKMLLGSRSIEDLVHLPMIEDRNAEAAIRVLSHVGPAVYFALPSLFPLVVCKLFYLMVKYGHTPYSGVVCAGYGQLMIGGGINIDAGYRIGKIALHLADKFEVNSFRSQCIMQVNTYIFPWKDHIRTVLEPLKNNYWYSLETGNIAFAAFTAVAYCYNCFFSGRNLQEVTEEMQQYLQRLKRLWHESSYHLLSIHTQAALNLVEPVEDPVVLTGRVHNEPESIRLYANNKGHIGFCNIYIYKLMLAYLFGRYDKAENNARILRQHIKRLMGASYLVTFYFYDSLSKLALAYADPEHRQKKLIREASISIRRLSKVAAHNPSFGYHKLLLVKAELCRATGQFKKAALLYNDAIESARKYEYYNDVALSCELAGKFYLSQNRTFVAQQYIVQACKFYQQWGASTKVSDLQQKFNFILEKQQAEAPPMALPVNNAQVQVSDASARWSSLDLYSIMKAASAISSEVQLSKLLKKLVRIAVENAGAHQGYLILKKEEDFFIEAEGSIETEEEDVIVQSVPIKGNQSVLEPIVQFVYVTKENLVIDNATQHPHLPLDPAVMEKRSKNILCMPIIHQADVIGLLYFENDLIANAFTEARIELLKLLSGQMAVSLQNALNEQKKMKAIKEREKLLEKVNQHQQELLKTKLEIQEQTYHNISEEIHDNIGQTLTLIKLNMHTIDLLEPANAQKKLAESKILLTKTIQDLRDLAKTLNTDLINKLGLVDAIEQQLHFLKRTGLYSTQLSVSGDITRYGSQRELVIFRIVQELLNNVVKHAEATEIVITIEYETDKLVIVVQDNGKGFDHQDQSKHNKGLGLRNIQNRIKLIQGTIYFDSQFGKGTAAFIKLKKKAHPHD